MALDFHWRDAVGVNSGRLTVYGVCQVDQATGLPSSSSSGPNTPVTATAIVAGERVSAPSAMYCAPSPFTLSARQEPPRASRATQSFVLSCRSRTHREANGGPFGFRKHRREVPTCTIPRSHDRQPPSRQQLHHGLSMAVEITIDAGNDGLLKRLCVRENVSRLAGARTTSVTPRIVWNQSKRALLSRAENRESDLRPADS